MMRKVVKRFFLGSDKMLEEHAEKFAKSLNKEYDDMREANIGFYDMPARYDIG